MELKDFSKLLTLGHEWQFSDPIYQRALMEHWNDKPTGRRDQRDAICDFYRDAADTLFWQPVAEIDDVIADEHATILGRLSAGSSCRNLGLVKLLDGMVRAKNPQMITFARLHERASRTIH